MKKSTFIYLILFSLIISSCKEKASEIPVEPGNSIILITLDGLRWQELFTGADSTLIGDTEYVDDTSELKELFWHENFEDRRRLLMPFFWSELATNGVLLGNRINGSKVNVTNNHWFSYPGYNEILTGFADDDINSNDKINNPNVTVLEFANKQPGFEGKVAAFGSWDVFPYIINEQRSGVYVNSGFEPVLGEDMSEKEDLLNKLQAQIPKTWSTVRVDAFTHHYALEYIDKYNPRLVYIAYGETDDFAHDGHYDQYLRSAQQTDAFIGEIFEMVNSNPNYTGKTSIVITTDHGRGTTPKDTWRGHGTSIEGADQIWIAAVGPGIKSIGESKEENQLFQNQIAATVAALLDLDYTTNNETGKPIESILK